MARQDTATALLVGLEAAGMSGRHHTSKEVMAGLSPSDSDERQDKDGRCIPSLLRASVPTGVGTSALVEEGGLAPCELANQTEQKVP